MIEKGVRNHDFIKYCVPVNLQLFRCRAVATHFFLGLEFNAALNQQSNASIYV